MIKKLNAKIAISVVGFISVVCAMAQVDPTGLYKYEDDKTIYVVGLQKDSLFYSWKNGGLVVGEWYMLNDSIIRFDAEPFNLTTNSIFDPKQRNDTISIEHSVSGIDMYAYKDKDLPYNIRLAYNNADADSIVEFKFDDPSKLFSYPILANERDNLSLYVNTNSSLYVNRMSKTEVDTTLYVIPFSLSFKSDSKDNIYYIRTQIEHIYKSRLDPILIKKDSTLVVIKQKKLYEPIPRQRLERKGTLPWTDFHGTDSVSIVYPIEELYPLTKLK